MSTPSRKLKYTMPAEFLFIANRESPRIPDARIIAISIPCKSSDLPKAIARVNPINPPIASICTLIFHLIESSPEINVQIAAYKTKDLYNGGI